MVTDSAAVVTHGEEAPKKPFVLVLNILISGNNFEMDKLLVFVQKKMSIHSS